MRSMFHRFSTTALASAILFLWGCAELHAQQSGSPTGQLPYGGRPVLQVAPDGAVHLDGPLASQSMPTVSGQPLLVPQPQQTTVFPQSPLQGRFGNWLFNNPIPYQYEHRTGFFGDFLFVRPRNAEVTYALPIDGPVAPVLGQDVPVGAAAVVDFEYEPAFRVGFNLRLREDSSIGAQYTNFRGEAADSVTVTAPVVLRPLAIHPLTANTATDVLDASATTGIDYDFLDVDYRATVEGCESCEGKFADVVNYIIGARYARLDQDFGANYVTTGVTSVATNVDFDGGGIRLGLEGERHATNTGLYVYGQGITNLIVGEFKANYRQVNNIAGGTQAVTSWRGGRVVPTLDLELGLGWIGPRRRLRVSGGYMVSTWFNVVKTEDFINAAQTHNFDDLSSILTFDGLVARAEWEF